jgi:hypothetical protein
MALPTEPTDVRDPQIALFRYGLIADLLHRDLGERGLYAQLREKASRTYTIPGTRRSRIAAETIRDWLQAWRKGGFELRRCGRAGAATWGSRGPSRRRRRTCSAASKTTSPRSLWRW